LVTIGGATIGRAILEPGWRWQKSVQPIAKTKRCEAPHFQYHVSGTLKVVMDDGKEFTCKSGDVSLLPSGHDDAWVVENQNVVIVDFQGMVDYAKKANRGLRIPGIAACQQEAGLAPPPFSRYEHLDDWRVTVSCNWGAGQLFHPKKSGFLRGACGQFRFHLQSPIGTYGRLSRQHWGGTGQPFAKFSGGETKACPCTIPSIWKSQTEMSVKRRFPANTLPPKSKLVKYTSLSR